MAERVDLQSADHRASVSVGSGVMIVRCAAENPDLHQGQLARVATLELEAEGCLTVEVTGERWGSVVRGKPGTITPSVRSGNHGFHRTLRCAR
jgi:hypothetical protein